VPGRNKYFKDGVRSEAVRTLYNSN